MEPVRIINRKKDRRFLFTAIAVAILFVFPLLFVINPGLAMAGQVTLAWDRNTEPDVAGYKLYYGLASRTYGAPTNVGNVASYTITGLAQEQTYYFALTAFDTFGNESGYSQEVSYTTPGAVEIDVAGNAVSIVDGDLTPTIEDFTDFGSTDSVAGTVTRTFTIRNLGTSLLKLSGLPLVAIRGANAADFKLAAPPESSVAAGGSTTFQVLFNPSAVGMRFASISIASNDPVESPYNFTIQGNSTTPEINVFGNNVSIADGDASPAVADHTDFGAAPIAGGTVTRTFTILNMGTGDLTLSGSPLVTIKGAHAADFTVTTPPESPIAAGGSTTFQVTFDPGAAGARVATLNITNNDANENPCNFAIKGVGTTPKVYLSGNTLNIVNGDASPSAADHTDFGLTDIVAGSVTRTFTIRNLGTEPLVLTGSPPVVVDGINAADFTVTMQPPATVAAAARGTFQVTFNPGALGTREARLSIPNSDPTKNPFVFAIRGTGANAPEINLAGNSANIADGDTTPSAEDHTDFGSTDLAGSTITRSFTIQNSGTAALNLTGSRVTIGGANAADFKVILQPPSSIAAGESAAFEVRFDPIVAGKRVATIVITNNDSTEARYDFAIQGTGITPEINLTGNSMNIIDGDASPTAADHTDFGSTLVEGGTVTRTFTIWNAGSGVLNLSGSPRVAIGGTNAADFTVAALPTTPIAIGGSTTFEVRFDPSAAGIRAATISIANNDANENPYNFTIRGIGTTTTLAAALQSAAGTAAETLSKPTAPSGPTSLSAGATYTYSTHGAISSSGDAVQYRFSWSDGTTSGWLPVGVVEATKSWVAAGVYTQLQVQARCASHPSVISPMSAPMTVTVGAAASTESITRPGTPVGASRLSAMATSVYRTGGAVSNSGHALQYRFLWSDGTMSGWLPVGVLEASKSWSSPGIYEVRTEARCALHPSVVSSAAPHLMVNVSPGIDETLSEPAIPQGPGEGQTGFLYAFDAGGASSSVGDPMQYRFQWGDGTTSDWITTDEAAQARSWKFWSSEGVYSVTTETRCAVHPELTISSSPVEVQIVRGDPEMFFDTFAAGTSVDETQWQVISGGWVLNPDETFSTDMRQVDGLAIVKTIPEFTAGRLATQLKLASGSTNYYAGIIFSYRDAEHYRYVILKDSYLYLGQVGESMTEQEGVKASLKRSVDVDSWRQLRVDIQPDGDVKAYFGQSELPALTFRFVDPIGGQVGCTANMPNVRFDDFGVWDERVLLR